jgi:hypothetical protein
VLLDNKLWTGAYYMTGLAVECALKSCLADAVKEHDFPDKKFVNDMYDHNLEKLFRLNGALWVALQADMKTDGGVAQTIEFIYFRGCPVQSKGETITRSTRQIRAANFPSMRRPWPPANGAAELCSAWTGEGARPQRSGGPRKT